MRSNEKATALHELSSIAACIGAPSTAATARVVVDLPSDPTIAITRVLRPAVRRYANAMRESTGHNRYMTPLRSSILPAAVGSIAIISASP
jgi:hypothetical protein